MQSLAPGGTRAAQASSSPSVATAPPSPHLQARLLTAARRCVSGGLPWREEEPSARSCQTSAIHIDRRAALDSSWDRQQRRESREQDLLTQLQQNSGLLDHVVQVEDLAHLEAITNAAGPHLCVLFLYSKACGTCKQVARELDALCKQQAAEGPQQSPIIFLKHDVFDEYDWPSTLARFHHVKAVPTFFFLSEGAVVKRMSMRDIRTLASAPKAWIQHAMDWDVQQLRVAIAEARGTAAAAAAEYLSTNTRKPLECARIFTMENKLLEGCYESEGVDY